MADTNAAKGNSSNQAAAPSLNVLAQFVKDFSFENPNAPDILAKPPQGQPQINIQVNVNARQLSDSDYEVDLQLEAKAGEGKGLLFSTEITYSGIFRIQNVPTDSLQPVIMIECPRLLFPFARQIIADATRNGGYPPLMIDPIDFVTLYRQRAEQPAAGKSANDDDWSTKSLQPN
jgi:preprotein translocase subunit SecB